MYNGPCIDLNEFVIMAVNSMNNVLGGRDIQDIQIKHDI